LHARLPETHNRLLMAGNSRAIRVTVSPFLSVAPEKATYFMLPVIKVTTLSISMMVNI
jgi:hypothetical protein